MSDPQNCPLCTGTLKPGTTTFTADFGAGVVVVRHVPAEVCSQCAEAWGDDDTAGELERLVEEARSQGKAVQVIDLAA